MSVLRHINRIHKLNPDDLLTLASVNSVATLRFIFPVKLNHIIH